MAMRLGTTHFDYAVERIGSMGVMADGIPSGSCRGLGGGVGRHNEAGRQQQQRHHEPYRVQPASPNCNHVATLVRSVAHRVDVDQYAASTPAS